ncbi:DUF4192 domain-containing protein [Streptomyces sp. NRRL F-5065]|uniref:DUF4192 domain-containing protein n=1 Tax=Streptomyces sp. NRRL F-5065 TaxID=1463855 RepID=UPI00099D104F|nr:DUF4192 domain-containing protein [Streptomyces sp. NRRL F-5065]
MTNHSEPTGPFDHSDSARTARPGPAVPRQEPPGKPGPAALPAPHGGLPDEAQVTLSTPAELVEALPYLLGYRPEDSIVLAALRDRDGRGRFGGRARLGIPADEDDWAAAARQLAHGLIAGSERRGVRPEQMVAFLCRDPAPGESGRQVMTRLRPLAQALRVACGVLDVPVVEALCVSEGRFWSYCCDDVECCPPEGTPLGLPGTSVVAAAATYAGIQVRGSLGELRARLLPRQETATRGQEAALDAAGLTLVTRLLDDACRPEVEAETLELAERIMRRLSGAGPVPGAPAEDARDDALLSDEEAAVLIFGLQDRATRDRAAEWMEGADAGPALRLWRALSRRCAGAYGEHAAATLALAGWVAWSTGDEVEAREAFAMALGADPDYLFARLLHRACNEGLDPESVRRCLRAERDRRTPGGAEGTPGTRSARGLEGAQATEAESGEAGDAEESGEDARGAGPARAEAGAERPGTGSGDDDGEGDAGAPDAAVRGAGPRKGERGEPVEEVTAVRTPSRRRGLVRPGASPGGVRSRTRARMRATARAHGRAPGPAVVRPRTPVGGTRPGETRMNRARARAVRQDVTRRWATGHGGAHAGGAREGGSAE